MTNTIHELAAEFPQFKDKIHKLKMSDNHFARLYHEYQDVNMEVEHMESKGTPNSDSYAENLKKKRLSPISEVDYRSKQSLFYCYPLNFEK